MDLIAWVAILAVVVVGLLLVLGAVWVRSAQRIVEAQEDAAAADERADVAEGDRDVLEAKLDAALMQVARQGRALDRAIREALQQGAQHHDAAVARDEAVAAARLALVFYGREHNVAVQAAEAWEQQAESLALVLDAKGLLQDEVDELRAAVDVAVDERATLREQVRAAEAAAAVAS